MTIQFYASDLGFDQAGDHVEHGRFAGSVGAEQAHRLTFANVQADFLDHPAPDKALFHAVNGKDAFAIGRGSTVHSASRSRAADWRGALRSGLRVSSGLALTLLRPRRRLTAHLFGRIRQTRNVGVRAADVSSHRPEAYGALVHRGFTARLLRAAAEKKGENVRHSDLRSTPAGAGQRQVTLANRSARSGWDRWSLYSTPHPCSGQ